MHCLELCPSSVEGDDWEAFGPQHLLEEGPATFSTGRVADASLELVLEQPSFVAGVVIRCPLELSSLKIVLLEPSPGCASPDGD